MPQDLNLTYLDITPDDRDPQAIFDAAVAQAQAALPTWVARNGNVEVVLMEALCLAVSDAVYALNRIPPVVLEAVLALYGVERGLGDAAIGQVTITFDTARSLLIPAGSQMQDPTTGITIVTTADTTVTSASTAVVDVVAVDAGSSANAIATGTSLDMIDLVPYAVSAAVSTGLSGGTDPEDDTAYFDRAATVLARVTSSLVLPIHFVAYCLEDTRVLRATSIDVFEPGGTPGLDLGHITIYLYGRGAQVPVEVRSELQSAMQAMSSMMLTVHVEPAVIVTQDVEVDVVKLDGYASEDIAAAVEAALTAYLSTDTWAWGEDILPAQLISVIDQLPGVDYTDGVTTPSGTVAVDVDELVQIGTITVNVA
jgi:uncharacterized phage protein gp47/JayE